MSLPWRPGLQQLRTRSGCETLRRRRRVKLRRKSEYAFRTPAMGVRRNKTLRRLCFRKASRSQAKSFVHGRVLGLGWRGGVSVPRFPGRLALCRAGFFIAKKPDAINTDVSFKRRCEVATG